MQESISQAIGYLWGVWRHRWIALAIAWVLALGGWYMVWKMPDAYVASARVFVDTNSVLRPLLKGLAITPNISDRVGMMSRTLLSRPNLEKLSRMTDLDLQSTTEAEKDQLIARLERSITLSGNRRDTSMYNIEARDPDRDVAKRIVQSLITVFIENSLNDKREDSSGAQTFLDDQINDYERRLIEAEDRLARFKQRNVDVLSRSDGNFYGRLQETSAMLNQARLELQEAENRRAELQRQLDGEAPMSMVGGPVSPMDARIQALEAQLDQLLTRYTEKHPEVRQIRGLIEALEQEKADQLLALQNGEAGDINSQATSPVYQGMRAMLSEAEARVAELQVRVGEYERRVQDLQGKVNSIPEVEAQLKQLDRDYAVIEAQHKELLGRRESARLSQNVEDNANDVSFRVIDPPYVPLKPSDPNKPLLNLMVLGGALVAGFGVALLLSLLHPIITDARTLVATSELPLLGMVTYKQSGQEKRRDLYRFAGFAACSLALVITFAGINVAPKLIGLVTG